MPMTALQRFWTGCLLPWRAVSILWQTRGVKRIAILPLLVNAILYVLILAGAVYALRHWEWGTLAWTFWAPVGPALAKILNALVDGFKWLLLIPVLLIASYYTFTVMGLLVSFPFNAILSERVELALTTGMDRPALRFKDRLRGFLYSFVDSLWLAVKQTVVALVLLPLLIIPVAGKLPILAWFAYCLGLSLFDIPMGRNFLRNPHKAPVVRSRRVEVFGFGVAMLLLFTIPLAGLLILPVGVVAGTLLYCECDWEAALREGGLQAPPGFVAPRSRIPS